MTMLTGSVAQTDREAPPRESRGISSELEYFRSRLDGEETPEWLSKEKGGGRKIIGLLCSSVLAEVVLASGAVPMRLGSVWASRRKSCGELPRDICAVSGSCLAEARVLARKGLLDAVVVPATCDWKRKLAGLLAKDAEVIMVESPSAANSGFLSADLKRFSREVGRITDLPVVARNLKPACEKMAKANEAYAALENLRREPGCALSGADALAVEHSFLRDDISSWTEHCRNLVESVRETGQTGDDNGPEPAARIMLVGSPVTWSSESLVHVIEQAGAKVVCEDFDSRLRLLYASETWRSESRCSLAVLAARWARNCFCSLVGEDEELILRAMEDFKVEGVIGHVYRGCARTQMALPRLLSRAREAGVPSILLETQGDPNEAERLLGRIEPFIEIVLTKRRNGA